MDVIAGEVPHRSDPTFTPEALPHLWSKRQKHNSLSRTPSVASFSSSPSSSPPPHASINSFADMMQTAPLGRFRDFLEGYLACLFVPYLMPVILYYYHLRGYFTRKNTRKKQDITKPHFIGCTSALLPPPSPPPFYLSHLRSHSLPHTDPPLSSGNTEVCWGLPRHHLPYLASWVCSWLSTV